MKRSKILASAILAAIGISTAAVNAEVLTGINQVLNTGATTLLTAGDTDISTTLPGATTLASEITASPFVGFPIFPLSGAVGEITSWALTGDANNPFGASDLTFVYQLNDFDTQINTLTLKGFNLNSVYVGFNGSGVAGFDANLYTGVLSVNFANVITSGEISDYLYVYTPASVSGAGTANVVNDAGPTVSNASQILAPVAPVPEPSSFAILLGGLACLGLVLKHRRVSRV